MSSRLTKITSRLSIKDQKNQMDARQEESKRIEEKLNEIAKYIFEKKWNKQKEQVQHRVTFNEHQLKILQQNGSASQMKMLKAQSVIPDPKRNRSVQHKELEKINSMLIRDVRDNDLSALSPLKL